MNTTYYFQFPEMTLHVEATDVIMRWTRPALNRSTRRLIRDNETLNIRLIAMLSEHLVEADWSCKCHRINNFVITPERIVAGSIGAEPL